MGAAGSGSGGQGGRRQTGPAGFRIVDEGRSEGTSPPEGPAVTFGTFVLSLSTSALVHLGEGGGPEAEGAETPNLALARQTIDILEMLEAKTLGNLDEEESRLLEVVLHDLRMRFVRRSSETGG